MYYLEKNDLILQAYERLIDESSKDQNIYSDPEDEEQTPELTANRLLDELELQNIELIKSYIGTRYDVVAIFKEDEPIKNQIIVRALSTMILHDVFKRNAARKLPTDITENYQKTIELLEKIGNGRVPVSGLPTAKDDSGNPVSHSIYGNNSNKNFYI
jgi:phage gp36-like protein